MLIRLAYDIQFDIPAPVAMVALLNVHPSRARDLLEPDELQTEPRLEITHYYRQFRESLCAVCRSSRATEAFQFHAHSRLRIARMRSIG